jgi:hypothetical protein
MTGAERRTQNPELRTQDPQQRSRDVLRKTGELIAVLEADARHIQESLLLLDRLRSLLVKHDEAGLQQLLQQLRQQADAYAQVEVRRQRLRRQMAALLDCPVTEMTLSRLTAVLPPDLSRTVTHQRTVLRDLVDRLGREYRNTSLLLTDCVRFNHALFRAVFQPAKAESMVYGSTGTAKPSVTSHLMNVQF